MWFGYGQQDAAVNMLEYGEGFVLLGSLFQSLVSMQSLQSHCKQLVKLALKAFRS